MIKLEKKHLAVMMEAGYVCIGMKRYKHARELFEGLAVLEPRSEIPYVALGNVDFCEGKLKNSIKCYTQALKIDADSSFARVYLGEALFFDGKIDEAMALLTSVAKKDKGGAGDFAVALLDAIKKGFAPGKKNKGEKGKRVS